MKEENSNKKKIFKRKEIWITGIIGVIIGAALIYLLMFTNIIKIAEVKRKSIIKETETVVTVNNSEINSQKLYEEMQKYYPISYVLEMVDKEILEGKYSLTDEQKNEVEEQANSYIDTYKMYYGYTEEEFLEENGFENREDFINYLSLEYKRNLYYLEYLETMISQEEIEKYYNEEVFGAINTKHMLVQTSSTITDEQALNLAKEIIQKLDAGAKFEDVATEYGDQIVFEELGYNGFDSSLVSEYVEASKALENNTYSKEPVKTSFGYHVIYKIDQKEKPTLEEAKEDIITILGANLEEEDEYLRHKALIKLREENKIKFKDSSFEEKYKEYCDTVNGKAE